MIKELKTLKEIITNLGEEVNFKTKEEAYQVAKDLILKHEELYRSGKPIITDTEFDDLYIAFEELENNFPDLIQKDSPTQKIYDSVVEGLEKVEHESFMGSQEKANTEEELRKFAEKVNDDISVDYKFDGLTVVLRYNNGLLQKGITRGNGFIGEDITHAVRNFANVPTKIKYKDYLEVRAEALITFDKFEEVNEVLPVEERYSNPRNLVSGTVRNLDGNISKNRGVIAKVFDITNTNKEFKTGKEKMDFLEELGFSVAESVIFKPDEVDELIKYCINFEDTERAKLDYMIDGLVLKANNIDKRNELGEKRKYPNWSIAYKFKSLEARTKLLNVVWQTGKTGRLAPVGIIEPVEIDNVNIQRVTLNNLDWINEMNLKINSNIMLARANDVIPKVISVIDNDDNTEDIKQPEVCGVCGGKVVKDGAHIFCNNESCPAQVVERIISWCHRDRLDIPGLGVKVIQQMYDEGLVRSISDLYRLKDMEEEFLNLERQGKKSFDNAIEAIERSKEKDFLSVIYGLNISNLGSVASKTFVLEFRSFDNIKEEMKDKEAFKAKLVELQDFGSVMADSVINFFDNESNIKLLEELEDLGFNLETKLEKIENTGSPIEGKAFVITGTLSESRKHFKDLITNLGGKVRSSVSKNTDYLLAGEKAGSKKTQAEDLGVKILSEEDFNNLIK